MNASARVLLVGENRKLAAGIKALLQQDHRVLRRGGLARSHVVTVLGSYDLVVVAAQTVDNGLLEWLAFVRDAEADQRILVVATAAGSRDAAACINAGADDFVARTHADGELRARVLALLRRQPSLAHRIRHGPLELDRRSREFRLRGKLIKLPRRSYDVLEALLIRRGGFIDKKEIAEVTTPLAHEASTNAVEQQIHHLRKMLASSEVTIRMKRGLGYTLEVG